MAKTQKTKRDRIVTTKLPDGRYIVEAFHYSDAKELKGKIKIDE